MGARPGFCPAIDKNIAVKCAPVDPTQFECQKDNDCQKRNQKCCLNICNFKVCESKVK